MSWIIPAWNSWIALLLYWLPMALCAYGYAVRTVRSVQQDHKRRKEAEERARVYFPSVTVGTIVGYVALTAFPIANLFAAVFDVAPRMFGGFVDWCRKALDIPLVPRRREK